MTFCFRLKQKAPRKKRIRKNYLKQRLQIRVGENDHRSPSNRAQGHAYGQKACGVILPTSRPQTSKKKKKEANKGRHMLIWWLYILLLPNCKTKTIQKSNSKQITFTDYTILNACPDKSARCAPPDHTPSTSSPKVV